MPPKLATCCSPAGRLCVLGCAQDSSANKCGVVCSSMEIVASMTLSDDEFVELKPTYVAPLLERRRLTPD